MTIIPYLLLQAIMAVESGGNTQAVGDAGRSLGPFQISQGVVDDVNRITGTAFVHRDMFDVQVSGYVCLTYLQHYATAERIGREPTMEDMARIWNFGPSGWANPKSLPYWAKIQQQVKIIQ